MIKLIVEDYCHECPCFEPEVRRGDKTVDGHVTRTTNVFCEHRLRCDTIARHITKHMKEKNDDQT